MGRAPRRSRPAEDASASRSGRAGVPHLSREAISPRHPVHVTMRVQSGVGYLRAYWRARLLEDAFREARLRFGMRIIHYSIQGNHLHLLVEVDSAESLSRGMQGLAIRVAKGLNALSGTKGAVFARSLSLPRAPDAARGCQRGPLRPRQLSASRARILAAPLGRL